jgi:hypothetical protein
MIFDREFGVPELPGNSGLLRLTATPKFVYFHRCKVHPRAPKYTPKRKRLKVLQAPACHTPRWLQALI